MRAVAIAAVPSDNDTPTAKGLQAAQASRTWGRAGSEASRAFHLFSLIAEIIATRLEDHNVEYAQVVRTYSWPIVLLILLFANALIKSLVLKLIFAVSYSPRLILALFLSNFSGVVLAVWGVL